MPGIARNIETSTEKSGSHQLRGTPIRIYLHKQKTLH